MLLPVVIASPPQIVHTHTQLDVMKVGLVFSPSPLGWVFNLLSLYISDHLVASIQDSDYIA